MKRISFKEEIQEKIITDSKYCSKKCNYKINTICNLFDKETKYDYKLDKVKRVRRCLFYFK